MKAAALCFFGILVLYTVFSFSLTDPNLVLTTWQPYWQFQQWMWQAFFINAQVLTTSYFVLMLALFAVYAWLCNTLRHQSTRPAWWWYVLIVSPLLFAYNALSHDVFNYIFNAKMILVYHANPHTQVALDFEPDEWLRFMHNTHTPAPYGYGWTVLSLIPSVMGVGKFIITWIAFRLMAILSVGLLWGVYRVYESWTNHKISPFNLALVLLNPLFIIEIIGNQHNDLWMMVPAVLSLVILTKKPLKGGWISLSLVLLLLSISTKLASVVLLPLWIVMMVAALKPNMHSGLKLIKQYWPFAASLLMFIPLLTSRSQQFHPWYLVWVLVWLPLFVSSTNQRLGWVGTLQSIWKYAVIVLSLSSLLRYIPWLWTGGFEGSVLLQQKAITWIPFVIALLVMGVLIGTKTPVVSGRGK